MLESLRVIHELDQQNAAGNLLLTRDQYIAALGLGMGSVSLFGMTQALIFLQRFRGGKLQTMLVIH